MDQQPQSESAAVGRGHNSVHVVPTDWAAAPLALGPIIDRLDASVGTVQLLVVAADPDAAVAIVSALVAARGAAPPRAVAATGAPRTARLLRADAATIVVGDPEQLVALLRASALKLDGLRGLVIAWIEDVLAAGGAGDLEALMAEIQKDVPRTILTATLTPEVEDFIERYARRAPRIGVPTSEAAGGGQRSAPVLTGDTALAGDGSGARIAAPVSSSIPITYVLVTPPVRATALRRVLDEVDPPSAMIYVRSDESERTVRETLLALGYHGDDGAFRITRGSLTEHAALLVLYDLPHDTDEMRRAAAGAPARTAALLLPRQLGQLRALTTGSLIPFAFAAPVAIARAREEALRVELRRELAAGVPAREVLALEPMLAEFDGVALAAAALRLLERERAAATRAASVRAAPPPAVPASDAVRPSGGSARGGSRPFDRSSPGGGQRDGPPRDSGAGPRGRSAPRADSAHGGPRPGRSGGGPGSVGAGSADRNRPPVGPSTRPLPRNPR